MKTLSERLREKNAQIPIGAATLAPGRLVRPLGLNPSAPWGVVVDVGDLTGDDTVTYITIGGGVYKYSLESLCQVTNQDLTDWAAYVKDPRKPSMLRQAAHRAYAKHKESKYLDTVARQMRSDVDQRLDAVAAELILSGMHEAHKEQKAIRNQMPEINYQSPYRVAAVSMRLALCPHCGTDGTCSDERSQYPFRFTPPKWSVNDDGYLACGDCVAAGNLRFSYMNKNDAFSSDNSVTTIELQETAPMTTKTKIDTAKTAGSTVFNAAKLGAKMAAVNKAGDLMLRIAQKVAENNPTIADMLETTEGREIAKAVIATGLVGLGTFEVLPKGNEALVAVGELQLASSTFVVLGKYGDVLENELAALVEIGTEFAGELPSDTGGSIADAFAQVGQKAMVSK